MIIEPNVSYTTPAYAPPSRPSVGTPLKPASDYDLQQLKEMVGRMSETLEVVCQLLQKQDAEITKLKYSIDRLRYPYRTEGGLGL
jgi:hypothetical protein